MIAETLLAKRWKKILFVVVVEVMQCEPSAESGSQAECAYRGEEERGVPIVLVELMAWINAGHQHTNYLPSARLGGEGQDEARPRAIVIGVTPCAARWHIAPKHTEAQQVGRIVNDDLVEDWAPLPALLFLVIALAVVTFPVVWFMPHRHMRASVSRLLPEEGVHGLRCGIGACECDEFRAQ
jgi:hypothetical protein